MRMHLGLFAAVAMTAGVAEAGSQSSNTSSNSTSNNGIVDERIVDTYCEDGYCERRVLRRVYRNDWRHGDESNWRRYHDDDD
ncbi:hypothetical protein [Ensifer aridi]|uniref:hypothetical protein n=1 Tax=Ensifer aridi TaxID=1708715 RepID=UPI00047D1B67|nr:hypothetical protein [Ensifer aridi]